MKNCMQCNTPNVDNATFCRGCGAALPPAVQYNTSSMGQPSVTQPFLNPVSFQATPQYNQDITQNKEYGKGQFVSSNEVVVATLSNGFVDNILSGEGFHHEDAVLTDKRLYYNHFSGIINITKMEEKVDVKDITGTKILSINHIGLLILAAIIFFTGVLLTNIFGSFAFIIVFSLLSINFIIIYFITLKKHLRIEYAGGYILFSVRRYGMANIQAFQKSIHLAKDKLEEKRLNNK